MTAESLLKIRLFEPIRVQFGDRPPIDENYPRRKVKALLVYLYLNRGRQISKYQLLADLWPEAEHADTGRVKHTVQVLIQEDALHESSYVELMRGLWLDGWRTEALRVYQRLRDVLTSSSEKRLVGQTSGWQKPAARRTLE